MKHARLVLIGFVVLSTLALTGVTSTAASGPLANATVSFGQWPTDLTDPPLDRLEGDPAGRGTNNHEVIPNMVTIKAGGAVNFIISGLHNVQVYDDGTKPDHLLPLDPEDDISGGRAGGIIDVPDNRIYRGRDPNVIRDFQEEKDSFLLQLDWVETVQFTKPGTYLVICGVVNHFMNDGMFGFVRVLP